MPEKVTVSRERLALIIMAVTAKHMELERTESGSTRHSAYGRWKISWCT